MKRIFFSLGIVVLCVGAAFAGKKKDKKAPETETKTIATTAVKDSAKSATTLKSDDMAFEPLTHDFGTVTEGPDATCVFQFKNMGKEPIIIQKAQPSCGCTVPSFSSEPVLPGATGTINVAYHTKGKPGSFTKTITVQSNAGSKMLTIKGTVEKAPTGSVPENSSMLKVN
jgi:Protein of unknown function (DUF1573)